MKKIFIVLTVLFILTDCSNEDDYVTVKGRVERSANGVGIPNQKVHLYINQVNGSGLLSSTKQIDEKLVTTDANGNFSASMKTDSKAFITVYKSEDENFTSFELGNFDLNDDIILKVNKYIKFKVYIKNTNSFNENDYIDVDFFSGFSQSVRTKVENFGILNYISPQEGGVGPTEYTSWKGTNVDSVVYYNVPENAEDFKIRWFIRKNGIETSGFTNNIQFQENQMNEYIFEY